MASVHVSLNPADRVFWAPKTLVVTVPYEKAYAYGKDDTINLDPAGKSGYGTIDKPIPIKAICGYVPFMTVATITYVLAALAVAFLLYHLMFVRG